MPFTVGYLPAEILQNTVPGNLHATPGRGVSVSWSDAPGSTPRFAIAAMGQSSDLPVGVPSQTGDGSGVQINLGPFVVFVDSRSAPPVPYEELAEVARSISVTGDWNDPNTWTEAARAFPTR